MYLEVFYNILYIYSHFEMVFTIFRLTPYINYDIFNFVCPIIFSLFIEQNFDLGKI